jgi:4-diphosphocytidyl-2-C-methyl-D-erythritol kinase
MTRLSPCKINLLLNILGRRFDGFHELETVMHPVALHDRLEIEPRGASIALTCSEPTLPTDARNLVWRAAELFRSAAGTDAGVRIHLEKRVPMAAGLGGGSANAATTLLAMNDLFGMPLTGERLAQLAAQLGSDVPFFLQTRPALALGRGERIEPLEPLAALRSAQVVLVHPGFGIATAWAYARLAAFPQALNGTPGRARALVDRLRCGLLADAGAVLYNALEAPALEKHPILSLYKEFFRDQGAGGTLMSGSGSTTFALMPSAARAQAVVEAFRGRFGPSAWVESVALEPAS